MKQVSRRDGDAGRKVTGIISLAAFARIAAIGEAERRLALRDLIREEYGGDPIEARRFTAERLHAWALLGTSDLEGARRLGRSYDAVFEDQPASIAMRRAMTVQSVMGSDFREAEQALLMDIIPGMRRQVPRPVGDVSQYVMKPVTPDVQDGHRIKRGRLRRFLLGG